MTTSSRFAVNPLSRPRKGRFAATLACTLAGTLATGLAFNPTFGPAPAHAAPNSPGAKWTKVAEHEGVTEFSLPNGLQVLVHTDRRAPLVSFMVVFKVGSRHEKPGHTGATHLLEHLMFKGTPKHNREKGNAYDQVLRSIGANYNATTWLDRTNYFATFPRQHLDMVLNLEADRMGNAWVRESDRKSEMTVVRNEMERAENMPEYVLETGMMKTVFHRHGYGHATIGYKDDVETMPIEDLQHFFKTYYRPDNATIIISGDVGDVEAVEKVAKAFAGLAKPKTPVPTQFTQELPQQGERRIIIRHPAPLGLVSLMWRVPAASHADVPALYVLDAILSGAWGSKVSSRLYQSLVEKGLARSSVSNPEIHHDPGVFQIFSEVMPESTHAKVEEAVLAEVEKLKTDLVSDAELSKAKNQIDVGSVYGREGSLKFAFLLGESVASGDWKLQVDRPAQIRKVTAEDVRRVARTYLTEDSRSVGYLIPAKQE